MHKELNLLTFKYKECLVELEDLQLSSSKLKRDFRQANDQRLKLSEENLNLQTKLTLSEKLRYQLEHKIVEKTKQLESTIVVLQNNKEKLEIVEAQLNDMQTQNYKMSIRAATAYNELTPRYHKFNEIFTEFKIHMNDEGKDIVKLDKFTRNYTSA